MTVCERHGTPKRTESLTRPDGKPIGTLTIEICDRCDEEIAVDFESFKARGRDGDFEDSE